MREHRHDRFAVSDDDHRVPGRACPLERGQDAGLEQDVCFATGPGVVRVLPEAPQLLRVPGSQKADALAVPVPEALLVPVGVDLSANTEHASDRGARLDGASHAGGDDGGRVVLDESSDPRAGSPGLAPAL